MKRNNLLSLLLVGSIAFFSSCSKDDDHAHDNSTCHECPLALDNPDYVVGDTSTGPHHYIWHILDADGEEVEFCGDDLATMEGNDWTVTIPAGDGWTSEDGSLVLAPGTYTSSSVDPVTGNNYESHCHD